jgi:hypothetical protein
VIDPRTGQILRGHARIEGLRGRRDVLICSTLLEIYDMSTGTLVDPVLARDVMEAVMMRHRQLGAHETGHTLGLAHNFMGSVYADQRGGGSVMDYPPPIVALDESGNIILNNASYGSSIGWFDKVSLTKRPRDREGTNR